MVLTGNHVVQVLVPQLLPGPALPGALPAPLQLDPHVALPAAPLTSSSPAPPPARLGLGGVLGVGQLLPQLPHHHLVAGPVLSTHHTLTLLKLELTGTILAMNSMLLPLFVMSDVMCFLHPSYLSSLLHI